MAGEGVGVVTKPGLNCPVGKPAINPVPRSMIFHQAERACRESGFQGCIKLSVSVPGGKEQAEKTFNQTGDFGRYFHFGHQRDGRTHE